MINIDIKPLSVNKAYKGKKYKTRELDIYKEEINNYIIGYIGIDYFKYLNLDDKNIKLKLDIIFGFSSIGSDVDNPLKPFIDSLQEALGFNDNKIYELNVKKEKVKKGEEFIKFEINRI